jgi:hypothetical protein
MDPALLSMVSEHRADVTGGQQGALRQIYSPLGEANQRGAGRAAFVLILARKCLPGVNSRSLFAQSLLEGPCRSRVHF